jgi:Ca2+-binding RTX toxin-like protein
VIQLAGKADTRNPNFQASDISGQSFIMKSDATSGAGFTVTGAATTTVIDLSTLTIDQTLTKAVTATTITAAAGSQGAVITGTAVADTITGSGHADTITGGNGIDIITGGAGNDTITITETTANSAADDILFSAAASNGHDTITGFLAGTDDLSFVNADTTDATTAGAAVHAAEATALITAAGTFTIAQAYASADVVELTTTLSDHGDLDLAVDGTELLKALSSSATGAATSITVQANGEKGFLAVYQEGKAYIYHVAADTGDATAESDDITLVATLNDIVAGTLVAGDFLIA